jgi:hypothetical protein
MFSSVCTRVSDSPVPVLPAYARGTPPFAAPAPLNPSYALDLPGRSRLMRHCQVQLGQLTVNTRGRSARVRRAGRRKRRHRLHELSDRSGRGGGRRIGGNTGNRPLQADLAHGAGAGNLIVADVIILEVAASGPLVACMSMSDSLGLPLKSPKPATVHSEPTAPMGPANVITLWLMS